MQWYWWIIGYLIIGLFHLGFRKILIEKKWISNWLWESGAITKTGTQEFFELSKNFWILIFWFVSLFFILFSFLSKIVNWFARGFGKYKY